MASLYYWMFLYNVNLVLEYVLFSKRKNNIKNINFILITYFFVFIDFLTIIIFFSIIISFLIPYIVVKQEWLNLNSLTLYVFIYD